MNVIVTGGAGLVGSHLCDRLIEDGHTVTAIDNFITGRKINIRHLADNPAFKLIEADIVYGEFEVGDADQIYHLASPASPIGYMSNPIATHLVNSQGTKRMLDLARERGARFLFSSTSEIYGNPEVHPQPESYFGNVNPVGPRSCYDESKRFGESITMEYVRQFDLDARIVRLFNIYGPRNDPNDGRVVPAFISFALQGKPLPIYGNGQQTRSLCYIDDLIEGIRRTMDTDGLAGKIINLGNPDERTVRELGTIIADICGSEAGFTHLPMREDDPERRCPDTTNATQLLGWHASTPLHEGLAETIKYFAEVEGVPRT
ncbi:MAG: UDP-glucuronic acid decarboxylase family protein [Thermomicrobiales bacterium]